MCVCEHTRMKYVEIVCACLHAYMCDLSVNVDGWVSMHVCMNICTYKRKNIYACMYQKIPI